MFGLADTSYKLIFTAVTRAFTSVECEILFHEYQLAIERDYRLTAF